jgi:hypothetical protein
MLNLISELVQDWRRLDERIASVSSEIEALAKQDASCQRLMSIPGVGPIVSSAVVAAIGNGSGFKQGRDFAAWLGLIPKQESTGDRTILGKISKRGNKYVRTLFVQAAHVVLERRPRTARQSLWPWIEQAPPSSARWNEEMDERSARVTKRLGAKMALQGLSASQPGCARIPMVVRSKNLLHYET